MDAASLIDIFLHLDKHLVNVVENYGVWVYALLFAIVSWGIIEGIRRLILWLWWRKRRRPALAT